MGIVGAAVTSPAGSIAASGKRPLPGVWETFGSVEVEVWNGWSAADVNAMHLDVQAYHEGSTLGP